MGTTEENMPRIQSDATATKTRILVVDDEATLRSVISEVLTDDGHEVVTAESAEQGLALFRKNPFPIVLTDIIMGRMSGLDLLKEVKSFDTDTLVVMMTSHASLDTATAALRTGAYDFLTKPFEDLNLISAVVNRAIERVRMLDNNRSLMRALKRNAEDLEALNSNLKNMVNRDGLTGLFNHRYFRDGLEQELCRAQRHGHPFSILFIDVDHFKMYNDAHGHLAGDDALRNIARILMECNRATSICARYGGEEFVILLPETDRSGARVLAERTRLGVEQHRFPGRETQPLGAVTISLGLACYPEDARDGQGLIGRADAALYEAKQKGRNTVCG